MVKLEDVGFPSKYLTCYESVLVTILKTMGLPEEAMPVLMGTQACFLLRDDIYCIAPRFNRIDEEWEQIHGLKVEARTIPDEAGLQDAILSSLDNGVPVCLSSDLYHLPHTPHYNQLHQYHYINIFGYDDGRYYVVCPFYRYRGWMDREFVHAGFLASPTVRERFPISLDWDLEMRMPLNHGVLIAVPELDLETLSFDKVRNLVEQSCRYMTGLAVPETLTGVASDCLGLAGIRTFSNYAKALVPEQERNLARDMLLYLSRQLMWVASSRYWFHQLIQRFQEQLLPVADERGVLLRQFETVIQTWRTVGARLGSDAHTGDPDAATRVAVGLEKAYKREARLFLGLLAALPGVDRRDEILESLYQRYPPASLEEQELQPASKFVAPRTPAEETLAKVWAEVLEVERVGVYDNFFDLGGDSLLMARVHGKLQENFGKDVSILDLFKNPTIGALARYMTQTQQEGPVREHTQERGQKYRAALMRQRRRLRGSDR